MTEFSSRIDEMSPTELAELAALCLEKLEPGRQPLPLFTQLARLVVMSTVEVVPFKQTSAVPKVLLSKRPDDDLWWPGQWHLPGTVLLPTDNAANVHDYDTPVERLLKDEFEGSIVKSGDLNIFDAQRRSGPRGAEQTVFGWTAINLANGFEDVVGGELFDASNVEAELGGEATVEGHLLTVSRALRGYKPSN